ncbi:Small-conductance mechanosensitive channel [Serratia quinivorans]|uniref:mechanosensitive channel protein n=1 Tax=Serratia quinivorans TaxID=137545 RepID=UPI00217C2D25|nr:mechanosensitive channel protein [Serratia quinivorans]CAI0763795.1 Small-conductance mechanosensitive channel [Serratia quinivorans]CAI1145650.1 Small-conductance mechanosensitive channel [Serratia quinivorans]CAI1706704.1 Small-conductance mechanosensitive channel [Serratia quinivorans]CAI1793230.1 Small-conductance mechanosensitive channel [Serratia quinivorans]CAI2050411.1 Small-conductance mechanosensitive channel [Serratia quinivorans]
MPATACSRLGSHLRERWFPLLLLLIACTVSPWTMAQPAQHAAPVDQSQQQKASYAALADILQDDKARAALIGHLRQAADESAKNPPKTEASETPESLSDNLSNLAQGGISSVNQRLSSLQKLIDSGPKRSFNPDSFFRALGYFLLTVVVTFALFHLIRRLIRPLYKRMGSWGHNAKLQQGPWYKLPTAILGAFAVDLLVLLLVLAAGNLFARHVNADSATILRLQTLFLSAFAVIEFFKAVLRLIFAPNFDYLRPFPFSDASAHYWNQRLAWLSGLIGYGLMVVVPVVATQISYPAAAAANLIIMLALTLYAVALILRNRKPIQRQINLLAERSMAFFSIILRGLGHVWHLLAIAYFLVLFALSQFDIGNSLRFMMTATVKSLLVVGLGALLSGMLTRWIFRRISLPDDVNRRYPMLERRINSYIPNGLKILRVIVVLAVTLLLFDAWHLINLYQWAGSENGEKIIGGLVHILLIVVIAVFSWTLMASIIEHRLALELSNGIRPSARERTLLTLFRNVLAIVISTITIMIVLSQVGINIAPLLAGAGALGLAISFGAQTLVKDVITGVFIQFENGMNTGEYVTVSGITGTVERMTIRSIGLRDDYGVYHIVPFSSITTLANYAREFGVYRANYSVSRDEDIDRVHEVLHQAVDALKQDEQVKHFLVGEPVFNGVVALGDRSFTTRVTVRTQALKQWVVQYALDRLVKMHFDQADIAMPQQAMQLSYAPGSEPPAAK